MATLQAGEKARMYALGKIARGGATRGGYVGSHAFIAIDGVHVGFGGTPGVGHVGTIIDSLSITDELNETPNTCQFRVNGQIPTAGAVVRVTLGSKNGGTPLFTGIALTVQQRYAADKPANIQADVHCVDYTWLLGFLVVTNVYRAQSASTIAADLVATYAAANGFTGAGIAAGLPQVDVITFTNEALDQALTRLAQRIGGYWYVGYDKSVHVFIDEATNGAPETLTPNHRSLDNFQRAADRTQVLTRCYVEGRGTTILGAVAAGDTKIPVDAIDMFEVAPDVFAKVSPHASDGGAKHLSFTGIVAGQAGSLVGPGVGPPGAPTLGRATGGALGVGRYQYAYTDVTPAGETLPSPIATIDVGAPIPAPSVAPTVQALYAASGVDIGTHSYAYSYVAGAGETTGGPISVAVATLAPLTPSGGISGYGSQGGGNLQPYTYYLYKVTYVGDAGGETIAAPYGVTANHSSCINCGTQLSIGGPPQPTGPYAVPAGVVQVKVYRSRVGYTGGWDPNKVEYGYIGLATPPQAGNPYWYFFDPGISVAELIPTTGNAQARLQKIRVVTTASPDPAVTGVKIYRASYDVPQGYKLVDQVNVAGGAVTYDDVKPNASLGAAPPASNTSGGGFLAVALSNIAPGPSPTNARRIYRTAVNGAQLFRVAGFALGDNTSTTQVDTLADSGLTVAAPASDTSGLQQVPGQVPAGSAAIVVANTAPFEAAGGWAVIGNGEQVIRYQAKSGGTLTGVPPTGIGAIVAAVAYNSTITAAPMVTGIPAGGARSIAEALTAGDDINVVIQRDNTARQADVAAMVHVGAGVREVWVQDRRLSVTEARARGDATLASRPLEDVTVTYTCRDLRTASGKTITVNLPAPTNVSGTFKIQSVTINKFRPYANQYPTFTVTASSNQFSFEDWLRQLETKV